MCKLSRKIDPGEVSNICINQCKAMCCRGPIVLTLSNDEFEEFERNSGKLNLDLKPIHKNDGTIVIKFLDQMGGHCPMLDPDTSMCMIYQNRPNVCRDFPTKYTPGCPISGG